MMDETWIDDQEIQFAHAMHRCTGYVPRVCFDTITDFSDEEIWKGSVADDDDGGSRARSYPVSYVMTTWIP